MANSSGKLPEYEYPPISEVVCGVMFSNLAKLLAPHLGLLWECYKPVYSECQELAPLAVQVEGATGALAEFEILEVPPLPRVWFMEPSGNRLIQVQRERFHHNWRKINSEDEYPRHKKVVELFHARLETFRNFLTENELGELQFKQFEFTYVNHILAGNGWETVADIGRIFPDFLWRSERVRAAGQPEGIFWKTVFSLPEGAGRLHVTVRNATRITDNQPILFFELTARGIGKESPLDDVRPWFEMAHSQIVRVFDDLVDIEYQRTHWGRKS